MLDALRKGAGTWIAKIFIGLLVLSFAVWGVADIFTGFGQNIAAKVGDTEISTFSFDRAYRQDLDRLGQQIGRPLSTTEGAQFGIPQQTLGRLVAEAAMNQRAKELKLGVSDQRLAQLIQQDPAFQRPGGGYDRNQLTQVLRNNGISEDQYVVERRDLAERQQLAEGISGGMAAPKAYVEALHRYQNETRDVSYLVLQQEPIADIADPSADALQTYFNENKAQFQAPEYREVALLELSSTTLARPDDISDADAMAEYERNKEVYFEPERRNVRQIVFKSADDAAAAANKLADGVSFEALMDERSLTDNDVNLGFMAQTDFLDSDIGDAVFALEGGETSSVIEGRFSPVVVQVTGVNPESTQPFDDVKTQIKAELARKQAEREVLDLLDEIEDARAGGALLSEVSERFTLPLAKPAAFDTAGKDMDGNTVDLPDNDQLISGVFASDVGVENDPLPVGADGFLWYEVTAVTPARDRELDEVRDQVIAAWKAAEAGTRLDKRAEELADDLANGMTIDAIAEAEGLEVQSEAGLTRSAPKGDIGRDALSAIFAGPNGLTETVPSADGASRLVLTVTSVGQPAFFDEAQEVTALRQQLSQQLQDSLLNLFVSDIETKAGIEVNDGAIAQVLGLTAN